MIANELFSRLTMSLAARRSGWLDRRAVVEAERGGVELGHDVRLPHGSRFSGSVRIGDHTWFSGPPRFNGVGTASVGRWCAIGEEFRCVSSNHDMGYASLHLGTFDLVGLPRAQHRGQVTIGNACWIGDRVTFLAGAVVGDGAVVGAGSVVTGELPPFSICVGTPARAIRSRFSEAATQRLLSDSWWTWNDAKIAANPDYFAEDLTRSDR